MQKKKILLNILDAFNTLEIKLDNDTKIINDTKTYVYNIGTARCDSRARRSQETRVLAELNAEIDESHDHANRTERRGDRPNRCPVHCDLPPPSMLAVVATPVGRLLDST